MSVIASSEMPVYVCSLYKGIRQCINTAKAALVRGGGGLCNLGASKIESSTFLMYVHVLPIYEVSQYKEFFQYMQRVRTKINCSSDGIFENT